MSSKSDCETDEADDLKTWIATIAEMNGRFHLEEYYNAKEARLTSLFTGS